MEIKFTISKGGKKRAYKYSVRQMRWFPIPLAYAEFLVATGAADDITGKVYF